MVIYLKNFASEKSDSDAAAEIWKILWWR